MPQTLSLVFSIRTPLGSGIPDASAVGSRCKSTHRAKRFPHVFLRNQPHKTKVRPCLRGKTSTTKHDLPVRLKPNPVRRKRPVN